MGYFPAFLKLDGKKVLIVGGGNIACGKLKHLLDFTSDIFVISSQICDEMFHTIQNNAIPFEKRDYRQGDIKDFDVVVIAVNDISLQRNIYEESREYRCLCNAVDSTEYCDFIFGSYIKKDELTLAISTSGASPAFTKELRKYLQKLIPSDVGEFLKEMKSLREDLPKGKQRMDTLRKKAQQYINKWSK